MLQLDHEVKGVLETGQGGRYDVDRPVGLTGYSGPAELVGLLEVIVELVRATSYSQQPRAVGDVHRKWQKTYWMRLVFYFYGSLFGLGGKAGYVAIQVFRIIDLEHHLTQTGLCLVATLPFQGTNAKTIAQE